MFYNIQLTSIDKSIFKKKCILYRISIICTKRFFFHVPIYKYVILFKYLFAFYVTKMIFIQTGRNTNTLFNKNKNYLFICCLFLQFHL